MPDPKTDNFSLKGEILEILDQEGTSTIKIICKPEWILLLVKEADEFKLRDKVLIDGQFKVNKMYKMELEKSESSTDKIDK